MAWLWVGLAALVFGVVVWLAVADYLWFREQRKLKDRPKPDYALIFMLDQALGFAPSRDQKIFKDAHETLGEQWAEWVEHGGPNPDINDWYQ